MDILATNDQLKLGEASAEILRLARRLQSESSPCNPDRRALQSIAAHLMDNASKVMCVAVKDD